MNYKLGFALGTGLSLSAALLITLLTTSLELPEDSSSSFAPSIVLSILIGAFVSKFLSEKMGRVATARECRHLTHWLLLSAMAAACIFFLCALVYVMNDELPNEQIYLTDYMDVVLTITEPFLSFFGLGLLVVASAFQWAMYRVGVSFGQKHYQKNLAK